MSEENKYIEQVGFLILGDGSDVCEVVSQIHECPDGDSIWFLIHNKNTGAKYRITVRSEDV